MENFSCFSVSLCNGYSNAVNICGYIIVILKMGIPQLTGVLIICSTSCIVTKTFSSDCQAVKVNVKQPQLHCN